VGCSDSAWDAQGSGELIALREGPRYLSGSSEPRDRARVDRLVLDDLPVTHWACAPLTLDGNITNESPEKSSRALRDFGREEVRNPALTFDSDCL
jgi:hypothetical protein